MKLKLISRQLLKNYVLIMLIILTLTFSTVFLYIAYNNSQMNKSIFDLDQFLYDYESGLDYALKNQALWPRVSGALSAAMVLRSSESSVTALRLFWSVPGGNLPPEGGQSAIPGQTGKPMARTGG